MGGWMTYQRARARAQFRRKPLDDPDPYFRDADNPQRCPHCGMEHTPTLGEGDFNRMERDYLNPVYPQPPWALREPGSDPLSQVVEATGVDVETVRRVLGFVFLEQL